MVRGAVVGLDRKRPAHSDAVANSVAELPEKLARKPRPKLEILDHPQDELTVECCSGAGLGLVPPPDRDRTRLGVRWRSESPDTGNSMKSDRVESAGKARTNA